MDPCLSKSIGPQATALLPLRESDHRVGLWCKCFTLRLRKLLHGHPSRSMTQREATPGMNSAIN
jgi:hypothetical protein